MKETNTRREHDKKLLKAIFGEVPPTKCEICGELANGDLDYEYCVESVCSKCGRENHNPSNCITYTPWKEV